MPTDRRAILHLVALGRITPAEGERLLIAWNEGRESLWMFAASIALALPAQLNPHQGLAGWMHIAHALLPGSSIFLDHVLSLLNKLFLGL